MDRGQISGGKRLEVAGGADSNAHKEISWVIKVLYIFIVVMRARLYEFDKPQRTIH